MDINSVSVVGSVDWFSYTAPFPDSFFTLPLPERSRCYNLITKAALPKHWRVDTSRPLVAPPGYRQCFGLLSPLDEPLGRVAWNADQPQQKIFVQLTGEDLAVMRGPYRRGAASFLVFFHLMYDKGVNVTRLDLAFDIFGVFGAVAQVYQALLDGEPSTSVRKFQYMVGYDRSGGVPVPVGDTLYLGSASSGRRLRVYDKQAEQGTDEPWVRFELVNRGAYANQVAGVLRRAFSGDVIVKAITAFFDTTISWFVRACDLLIANGCELGQVPRKDTDTDRWLRRVVGPLLKRRAVAADNLAYEIAFQVLGVWPADVVVPDAVLSTA